jgi:hypothetical protein
VNLKRFKYNCIATIRIGNEYRKCDEKVAQAGTACSGCTQALTEFRHLIRAALKLEPIHGDKKSDVGRVKEEMKFRTYREFVVRKVNGKYCT